MKKCLKELWRRDIGDFMNGKGFRFGSRTDDVNREVMKERASDSYSSQSDYNSQRPDKDDDKMYGVILGIGNEIYTWVPQPDNNFQTNTVKIGEFENSITSMCVHDYDVYYSTHCGPSASDHVVKRLLGNAGSLSDSFISEMYSYEDKLYGLRNDGIYDVFSERHIDGKERATSMCIAGKRIYYGNSSGVYCLEVDGNSMKIIKTFKIYMEKCDAIASAEKSDGTHIFVSDGEVVKDFRLLTGTYSLRDSFDIEGVEKIHYHDGVLYGAVRNSVYNISEKKLSAIFGRASNFLSFNEHLFYSSGKTILSIGDRRPKISRISKRILDADKNVTGIVAVNKYLFDKITALAVRTTELSKGGLIDG
jgi:hypothetical protein